MPKHSKIRIFLKVGHENFYKMDKSEESIGKRLAELRKAKGFTVRQLAELSGCNYVNISKIENGKYMPGVEVLSRILYALGYKIDFTPIK